MSLRLLPKSVTLNDLGLSFNLLYNFHRWKYLNGAELLLDALSVLFKF